MPAPTQNDWNAFEDINYNVKAEILYNYLYLGWTMADVSQEIFGENDARRISCITRCYGLEGRNGGIFSSWGLDRSDFMAFVKSYPNGCNYDDGKTITAFMKQRRSAKQNQDREEQERMRREQQRLENERRQREQQARMRQAQKQTRRQLEPEYVQGVNYNSYGGNSSYQGTASYEGNTQDAETTARLLSSFLIALVIRWKSNGTLFRNWFRGGITIFVGMFVLAEIFYLIHDVLSARGIILKVLYVVLTLISLAFAIYAVCAYPGNWIKRILFLIVSMVIKAMAIFLIER